MEPASRSKIFASMVVADVSRQAACRSTLGTGTRAHRTYVLSRSVLRYASLNLAHAARHINMMLGQACGLRDQSGLTCQIRNLQQGSLVRDSNGRNLRVSPCQNMMQIYLNPPKPTFFFRFPKNVILGFIIRLRYEAPFEAGTVSIFEQSRILGSVLV